MAILRNYQQIDLFAMELSNPTLSPGDTPASPFPTPGGEQAKRMTAISGQKCSALYPKFDRLGWCVKTLLGTSQWASTACYLTWNAKATPRKRLLFRLAPSVPRTDGTGFGLWPTPRANDAEKRGDIDPTNPRNGLAGKVRLWPTPSAGDYRSGKGFDPTSRSNPPQLRHLANGQLNPAWVEWLMGYPPGWTDVGEWNESKG